SRLCDGTPAVVVSRTGLVWSHVAQRSVTAPRSGRAGDPPTRHGRLRTHLGSPAHPRRGTRGRHPGGHGPAPRAPGHVHGRQAHRAGGPPRRRHPRRRRGPGGRITWHGPGQLVGYPIIALADPIDVMEYVRRVEQALITTCARLGVEA